MSRLGKVAAAVAMAMLAFPACADTVAAYVQAGLVACWDGVETVFRDGWQELAAYDTLSSLLVAQKSGTLSNQASYDIQLDLPLFGLSHTGNVGGLVSARCYSATRRSSSSGT